MKKGKSKKTIGRIFFTSALILANAAVFPWFASAATTYTLKSPVPSVVNIGAVSEGVSTVSSRVMWRGPNGDTHMFGAFGDNNWQSHYVNLTTGANALIQGFRGDARFFAYSPTADKLYMTGKYYAGMTEFDPNTLTARELFNPNTGGSNGILIGDDGLVYLAAVGDRLYSYNPTLGYPAGWKDYGVMHPSSDRSEYTQVAADGNYVYAKVRFSDGHYSLVVSPVAGTPNFTEWEFGSAGDTYLVLYKIEDGRWILRRTLSNDTNKYYHLHNGTYTELPGDPGAQTPTGAPYYSVSASSETDYGVFSYRYGWEMDFTDLFPIKGIHEFSTIKYRPSGTQNWSESTVSYSGPWIANQITAVVPRNGSNIIAISGGYGSTINLDFKNKAISYLGGQIVSAYNAMPHSSGEVYVSGYPSLVTRYNPDDPWTLTNSNATPRLPSDQSKPNPYLIQINPPEGGYHYRHGLDYDASGLVWIGGNTIRKTPDYGNVMWYDPANGNTGYMFPSWATSSPSVMFRNLTAAANRTKIVVSGNDGILTVINAATKTIDGTYNLGEYAYMADVNGKVVGVTTGGNIFCFDPISRSMITAPHSIGVAGTPFGWGNSQYNRMNYKLEKGPDNFLWMFVGDTLYRINPTSLVFEKVLDAPYAKIKFAANKTDLLLYGSGTDFKYIPGILEASQTYDAADLNEDNSINLTDFNILKTDFLKLTGILANPKSDINADGQCTVKDAGILMSGWKP